MSVRVGLRVRVRVRLGLGLASTPTLSRYLISSVTAIIHLSMGRIKTIVWDSGCNLCQGGDDVLKCMKDNTTVVRG